mgnify:CR=1 FL=1
MKRLAQLRIFAVIFAVALFFGADAIAKEAKDVSIKTNAHCGSCKTKIEGALNKHDGVIKSALDMETKVVKVTYNPDKTDEAKLVNAVSNLGYNAELNKCASGDKVKDAKSCGSKKAGECCSDKKTKNS